jgi:hypothetical protein
MKQVFAKLLNRLNKASNDSFASRRQFDRRSCDKCISVVNGNVCPVYNWSVGGALLEGDERMFSDGQEVNITLKFRIDDHIIDVDHRGRIIRKSRGKVALQFAPLTDNIWSGFRKVIDHHVASEFAGSQA